jgi:hypothetical protein
VPRGTSSALAPLSRPPPRAGPRPVLAIREARQGERHEPLPRREIGTGKSSRNRLSAHRCASEHATKGEQQVLDRPDGRRRTGLESFWSVMGLKAIANPAAQCGGSRWRSGHPPKTAQTIRPRRGSVLDAVKLRRRVLGSALESAYLLEDRAATRSFSPPEPEAGHDSAVEPIEPATSELIGSAVSVLPRVLVTIQRAGIGGCSPAGDSILWPVDSSLAMTQARPRPLPPFS